MTLTKRTRLILYISATAVICWVGLFWFLRSPVFALSGAANQLSILVPDLESHVRFLTSLEPNRSYQHTESMLAAEKYISAEFEKAGYKVKLQDVPADGQIFHNIIARYGPEDANEIIVIGAHYDACGTPNPGADDNASGVAGLIELAKLAMRIKPEVKTAIEFVAFTLEEPPFFRKPNMGSVYHAKLLQNSKVNVKLMISIEMIGYYNDDFLTQEFPLKVLYLFYPWRGNFIAVIGSPNERLLIQTFKKTMAPAMALPVYSINAPSFVQGVDFSDHRSYWKHKWPAIMITDTAFFRNHEYHQSGDTPDRLDYQKMADLVGGIYQGIMRFAE